MVRPWKDETNRLGNLRVAITPVRNMRDAGNFTATSHSVCVVERTTTSAAASGAFSFSSAATSVPVFTTAVVNLFSSPSEGGDVSGAEDHNDGPR